MKLRLAWPNAMNMKNMYLVSSMSRCSMFFYESGNGPKLSQNRPTEPKPPYIYIVNEDLLRSF